MKTQPTKPPLVQLLEQILAVLAAFAALFLSVGLWRTISVQQGMWPLPGLYFIELPVVAIVAAFAFMRGHVSSPIFAWAAAGINFAFAFVGAFSIGLFYLPIAIMFAMVAVLSTVRHERPFFQDMAAFLAAATAQMAFMYIFIRLV